MKQQIESLIISIAAKTAYPTSCINSRSDHGNLKPRELY